LKTTEVRDARDILRSLLATIGADADTGPEVVNRILDDAVNAPDSPTAAGVTCRRLGAALRRHSWTYAEMDKVTALAAAYLERVEPGPRAIYAAALVDPTEDGALRSWVSVKMNRYQAPELIAAISGAFGKMVTSLPAPQAETVIAAMADEYPEWAARLRGLVSR